MTDVQGSDGVAVQLGRSRAPGATVCRAPNLQLYLYANGDVGPCCRHRRYGNIATSSLRDLWHGASRRRLDADLRRGDFSNGCDLCGTEHRLEGPQRSFTATFDHWARELAADDDDAPWPLRMEFELSNTCNLRCVQCNGELSSSIRSQREHRAPMAKVYDDAFFDDLREFIPHLRQATFVGGEPFLSAEHHRVWDLVAELAPSLPCVVVTNATQWNRRVEDVLSRLAVQPYLSIDGVTRSTYESIRVGADFDVVMANVERFNAYAQSRGTTMSIVFCLMPSNVHELADMLMFAEERSIFVTVSVVREPADHSLGNLPRAALAGVLADLRRRDDELSASLSLNLATWRSELARIAGWVDAGDPSSAVSAWTDQSPRILMFRRRGTGPVDETGARHALHAFADGGGVHELSVGADDRASGVTAELAAQLRLDVDQLEGHPLSVLQSVIRRYEVLVESEDRYEAAFETSERAGRIAMVPRRDGTGWADEVAVLLAFAPLPSS